MKRILLCLLAGILLLITAGCGDKTPPNTVHSPEDVQDKVIGAISGSPSARLADELGTLRTYSSGADLMAGLLTGAVDCAIMENTSAIDLAEATQGVKILSEPLLEYELSFAVAKENAELKNAINSALGVLSSNGILNGLRDKYFGGKPFTYVPPENIAPHPGTLTVAVSPDDWPFSYVDKNGDYSGLNVQVALAVCDQLGVGLEIAGYETGELITSVWYGKVSIALGWLPGDVHDRVNLSDPYASSSHVIMVRN